MEASLFERIEYCGAPDLPGVQLLLANDVARRWRMFHETYAICTVLEAEGSALVDYRGKRHEAAAGDILLMEPGEAHANPRVTPRGTFRVLFLPANLMGEAAAELNPRTPAPHWRCALVRHPGVFRALVQLHSALERDASRLEREVRFCESLRILLQHYSSATRAPLMNIHPSRLARCRDFIIEHHADRLTLEQLAAFTATTRFQLVRAFKQAFGLAPHAYQIHVRVERARRLLTQGTPPASVAALTGFADQSHFGRHFLQVVGLSPAQYAREVQRRPQLAYRPGAGML